MSSFKEDFLAGKTAFDDITEYISRWHNSVSYLSVHEYLGLSEREYEDYITNTAKLREDLEHRAIEVIEERAASISRDACKALDKYVGSMISANALFEIRQVYVSQTIDRFSRVSLQHLDVGVEVEHNTKVNVYPKNFYTALVMAGFEPPSPPMLQDVFYSGNLKYTLCGRGLACSNI
jgi:hypothetical protein